MAEEYRIVGPPGTGKTRSISMQVEKWVDEGEFNAEDIVLTSFTRAAASVLAGRVAVPEHNIATLHALAYRAINRPPLAEKGELAKRWNLAHAGLPTWQVEGVISDEEDGINTAADDSSETGLMLRNYSLARARLVPPEHPLFALTREFAAEWNDFKDQTHSVDFCDMLEMAAMYVPYIEQPVIIVDEAQDLVPLQWQLIRQWGLEADVFMVAGDAAQVLYQFAGARPDDFQKELLPDHSKVLPRSYRMPRVIQEHAETYLTRHSGPMMVDRTFQPRDEGGVLRTMPAVWARPQPFIDDIEAQLAQGRDCMLLASCSYMLQPAVVELRRRGLPFANKYRRSNGAWNPLAVVNNVEKKSTARMLAAFRSGDHDKAWLDLIRTDVFAFRSAKKLIEEGGDTVESLLKVEHRAAFAARDLRWLQQHMLAKYEKPAEFAISVIERRGVEALNAEPKITVGTIHSVKGGEAQVVYSFPDVSAAGAMEMHRSTEGRDAATRLGYVAMSRASEELVLGHATHPDRSMW